MKRREFIALLGGAAAAWRLAARAQQTGKTHTIGLLSPASRSPSVLPALFDAPLAELGWIEGKNLVVERRYAENRPERLPELAAELVRLNVEVIVAAGTLGPLAAKQATSTIPIVMTASGDPLGSGLVASLARPGGLARGVLQRQHDRNDLGAKALSAVVIDRRPQVLELATTSVLRAVFASRDEPMASAPALPEATVSGQFVQIFGRKENPRGGDVLVKVRHR